VTRTLSRAGLAASALVLAGCSTPVDDPGAAPSPPATTTSAPTPAPTAPAPPAAPPQGACYQLSYDAALAPTTRGRDVDCAEQHTAQTFHVGRLDRLVGGRLLAVDARALQEQVADTCPDLLSDFIGGSEEQQRLSMLRAVWFTPTVAESDAGADWFRCDAVMIARADALQPVTGPLGGTLATEAGRERAGMCGTAEPGTDGFERVACAQPHSWRALRTVALGDGDYPGEGPAQAAGEEPCRAAARAAAPDPLDFQWGYEWPTAEQWTGGQTYGICWAPA
jgi:hypothetical protein